MRVRIYTTTCEDPVSYAELKIAGSTDGLIIQNLATLISSLYSLTNADEITIVSDDEKESW